MKTMPLLLGVSMAAAAAGMAGPRKVDCTFAEGTPNATLEEWYFSTLFSQFQDTHSRIAKQTMTFEALAGLSAVGSGHADLMEFLVTAKRLEADMVSTNVTVDQIQHLWFSRWSNLGSVTLEAAEKDQETGKITSAASGYARASTYLLMAERFMNHTSVEAISLYNQSVTAFQTSLVLTDGRPPNQNAGPRCHVVIIPFVDATRSGETLSLHGYWCQPSAAQAVASGSRTILIMSGYDGNAEMLLESVGFAAARRGYNVLAFEGPGQGSVARFQGLTFRPDWEFVVDQVAAWTVKSMGVSPDSLAVWGRSFGGYLSARAFAAGQTRFEALVADGGVADFYQTFVCALPDTLQQLWYTDQVAFEQQMQGAKAVSLSLRFIESFGTLGFGSSSFTELYTTVQNYTVVGPSTATGKPIIDGVGSRPVLAMRPDLELMTGNQSALFFEALPVPLNASSQLLQLSALTGAALHCGVGSTTVATGAELDWLENVFPPAD